MATIYLHIGMPKTGTSHIQNFLYNNEKALNKYGYTFPHFKIIPGVGKGRNAYFLRYKLYQEDGERDLAAEQQLVEHNFDIICKAAENYDKIILTEEGLWNIEPLVWTRYIEEAKKSNFDTKIIVYLRRQDLFLQSYWAQVVKEWSVDSFSDYIDSDHYHTLTLDYWDKLESLAADFGKENLIVRPYEKQQYQGKTRDLTSDFLKLLGIEDMDDFIMPDHLYNPSLTGKYLELKRHLNRNPEIAGYQSLIKDQLVKLMKEKKDISTMSSGIYYEPGQQQKLMSRFEEGNEKVARDYLGREDGKLFLDPIDDSGHALPEYTTEELLDVCGDLLVYQQKYFEKKMAKLKDSIAKKDADLARKQKVIDWETRPFSQKVTQKLKKMFGN